MKSSVLIRGPAIVVALCLAPAASAEELPDDIRPREVTFSQLPQTLERDGRHFAVEYEPLEAGAEIAGARVFLSDVTSTIEHDRAQAERRSSSAR